MNSRSKKTRLTLTAAGLLLLAALASFFLSGPRSGFGDPDITGYVTAAGEGEILVVAGELSELDRSVYAAAWVSIPTGLTVRPLPGEKVAVNFKGVVLQSYPARAVSARTIRGTISLFMSMMKPGPLLFAPETNG